MHSLLAFLAGNGLFHSFRFFPFLTISIILTVSLFFVSKRKAGLIFLILVGFGYAFVRYDFTAPVPYTDQTFTLKGFFESYPVETEQGSYCQEFSVHTARDATGQGKNEIAGKEIRLFSSDVYETGREYQLEVKMLRSSQRFNPGSFAGDKIRARILRSDQIGSKKSGLKTALQESRHRIDTYIGERFPNDSGDLIKSITIGQRSQMSEELREAFNTAGLAHILSISGTHFGLFSVILFAIFNFLVKHFPYRILQRVTIFLTPAQAAAILCFPFMLSYLVISGASIPAIRSFIMISLFLTGLMIGRKGFWLNSLLFAACILVLWEPEVILQASFQLSFIAVVFIGFIIDAQKEERKGQNIFIQFIKNALLITLAATIGTAPIVAHYFHYVSLISPVSNLIIAPLIGFILIPFSVFSAISFLVTERFIFERIVSVISDAIIFLVHEISKVPYADMKVHAFPPIILMIYYTGFLIYILRGRKKEWLIIPVVPILIYTGAVNFERKETIMNFLDVGQGDSSVIEFPDGKTMVIDTGRTGKETAAFLSYKGKKYIDMLVLSHTHPDHTGGVDYLTKKFRIGEIWDNGRMVFPEHLNTIKRLSFQRGDMFEAKGYGIYFLHPYTEFYTSRGNEYTAENNDSLVLKMKSRKTAILFTGDIEEEAEEDISHLGIWLKSDVLKVPHHGSKRSTSEDFLQEVSPSVSVIGVGRENTFHHPSPETLDSLQSTRIFRTDTDGAIQIKETPSGIETKTYRDFTLKKAQSIREEIENIKRLFQTW